MRTASKLKKEAEQKNVLAILRPAERQAILVTETFVYAKYLHVFQKLLQVFLYKTFWKDFNILQQHGWSANHQSSYSIRKYKNILECTRMCSQ